MMNEAMKEEWRTSLVGVRWVVETETGAHVTDCIQTTDQARLIAAAPDLLNACREALEIRNLAYQVDANPKLDILARREIERKMDGIIERIEAAIAKAEGSDR